MKYIVMVGSEYAVGPFNTREEAEGYVERDWQKGRLTIFEFVSPAPDWARP